MEQEYDIVLAIDTGNTESGYCITDKQYRPLNFGKIENHEIMNLFQLPVLLEARHAGLKIAVVLEMVASYGMPVGKEVFDTCLWNGVFARHFNGLMHSPVFLLYRISEKVNLCHSANAKDTNIRQALVDRFAYGQSNYGKGTKKNKGWFYGFKADVWAAYAVNVTFRDNKEYGKLFFE